MAIPSAPHLTTQMAADLISLPSGLFRAASPRTGPRIAPAIADAAAAVPPRPAAASSQPFASYRLLATTAPAMVATAIAVATRTPSVARSVAVCIALPPSAASAAFPVARLTPSCPDGVGRCRSACGALGLLRVRRSARNGTTSHGIHVKGVTGGRMRPPDAYFGRQGGGSECGSA